MDKSFLKQVYDWYYSPGEVLRSIGFYENPHKQWKNAKFRHIFAFDADCNLYVGQYSVYQEHFVDIFNLNDRREYGMLYPKTSVIKPNYSEMEIDECGIDADTAKPWDTTDVIYYEFIEYKNITYLNRRLPKMAQRLYDYGLAPEAVVFAKQVDLWQPNLHSILKGKFMIKPDEKWLLGHLSKQS